MKTSLLYSCYLKITLKHVDLRGVALGFFSFSHLYQPSVQSGLFTSLGLSGISVVLCLAEKSSRFYNTIVMGPKKLLLKLEYLYQNYLRHWICLLFFGIRYNSPTIRRTIENLVWLFNFGMKHLYLSLFLLVSH